MGLYCVAGNTFLPPPFPYQPEREIKDVEKQSHEKGHAPWHSDMILGMNMKSPTASAAMAESSTAAAARSFIFLILASLSGHTKSQMFSTAELTASMPNTSPMAKATAIHSVQEILNATPITMTQTVANRCILALCSSLTSTCNPLNA